MNLQIAAIFFSRAIRSFQNGILSMLLIYFFYRSVLYDEPSDIPISLAIMQASYLIKAFILRYLACKIGHFNILAISYLLLLQFSVVSTRIHMSISGTTALYLSWLKFALFSIDG